MTSSESRPILLRAARILAPAPLPHNALLLRDGRIAATGAFADLRAAARDAEVIELPGCTLTPGLTDAHVHLVEWAHARRAADLHPATSPEHAARIVSEHAAKTPDTGVLTGGGWDPHRWSDDPHRRLLDASLPGRAVLLRSHDLHSVWVSGETLRRAGITRSTPDPAGGRIERDPDGEPTGVLRENAQALALAILPPAGEAGRHAAVMDAQAELHRLGVTGVHNMALPDAGAPGRGSPEPEPLGLFEALRHEGRLRLRILQALSVATFEDALRIGLRSGFGGEWVRVGGLKLFLDGALGSRTALLRDPWEGTEDDRGVSTLDPGTFRDIVRRGSAAGIAMTVHAIGDAAVDLALDVLAGEGRALVGPVPHRIEHVQLIAPDRFGDPGAAGIVCSVQPSHLMTDWRAADRHWGARARNAFAFRSLARGGATLAFGSDAPVEPPDPRQGLYAAVARTDLAGDPPDGWVPEQRLTAAEALAAYSLGAAAAAGDPRQGRLEPGAFGDVVAWDRDPTAIPPGELLEMRCVMTIVGGDVVWREQG